MKPLATKAFVIILLGLFLLLEAPTPDATAGLMDKINAATQKMNQMKQNKSNGGDPDRPLHLEGQGHCKGNNTATCMDYMEVVDQCMDPLKGYRSKLYADLIEKKLANEKDLTAPQRKNLEEDLTGFKEAYKNKTDNPTIAGEKNSQRYLMDVTEDDQIAVNTEFGKFYQKIMNKCNGADHMGIGKRTEMNYIQDNSEEMAQQAKEKKQFNSSMDCLKNISSLRWTIMAEMMEAKMNKLNPSGQERKEWEEDIAIMKNMKNATTATMPQSPDPKNPMRYMMRLDSNEQMALNTEFSTRSQEEMARCQAMSGDGKIKERPIKKGGLVDKSKSPANKKAEKVKDKEYADLNAGRGGSTNLLALRRDKGCDRVLQGNLAKLTAEKLEEKLKSAKNLSAQKRQEWEEDIAAFRSAAEAGVNEPEPPDPDNPYRWYDYMTNQERAAINQQHAKFVTKIMTECNSRPSGL